MVRTVLGGRNMWEKLVQWSCEQGTENTGWSQRWLEPLTPLPSDQLLSARACLLKALMACKDISDLKQHWLAVSSTFSCLRPL